ncbi:unnamed protein product [Ilex paraguariensis]|uniref:Uncharacterized protein n=1 Tax=Ilex paraguariensis TaxID=185542 RepID=A0ABC8S9V1_9AQUA
MEKSPSKMRRKRKRTDDEKKGLSLRFTEPELDAALQLIQLSGDSEDKDNDNSTIDVVQLKHENQSNDDTDDVSSAMIEIESPTKNFEKETCSGRKRKSKSKFRSIVDLYRMTKPLMIGKHGMKTRR